MQFLERLDRRVFDGLRRQYFDALDRALEGCDSMLDVGCGADSPLGRLRRRPRRVVGVDAYQSSIARSRAAGIHDEVHCMDVLEVGARFPPRSFDAVFAGDLLEHLEKADGRRLLDVLERLARRRVVVFTPNGFLAQGALEGNPYQVHRSGWEIGEMRSRGYRITGIQGWKPLRGEGAAIRWHPTRFWEHVSLLSQAFTTRDPRHAFQILCVLDVEGARDG